MNNKENTGEGFCPPPLNTVKNSLEDLLLKIQSANHTVDINDVAHLTALQEQVRYAAEKNPGVYKNNRELLLQIQEVNTTLLKLALTRKAALKDEIMKLSSGKTITAKYKSNQERQSFLSISF